MLSFLSQVVTEFLKKDVEISQTVFVLPNQRAGFYLKNHIKEQLEQPAFFPEIITFDNLAEKISGFQKTASIEILFEFYKIYKKTTPEDKQDSFEVFLHWAKTVLDDFNLIDNHLVSQKDIFKTLKDINLIQNWDPNTALTKNYYQFLQHLEPLYNEFYNHLLLKQKAYQGMLFRESVEVLEHFVSNTSQTYVFAGFGILKKAESVIIQALLDAGKASIYWDFSTHFKSLYTHQSIFYDGYRSQWDFYKTNPFQWEYSNARNTDHIEIIGVSKKVGMLKYVGHLLGNKSEVSDTTLVLADQKLLPVALQSLPKEIETVNITMGIPLKNFPFSSLIQSLFELHIQQAATEKGFYYQNILKILQHATVLSIDPSSRLVLENFVKLNKVYIQVADIEKIFELFETKTQKALLPLFQSFKSNETIPFLLALNQFIQFLKPNFKEVELEVLFNHYQLNQQLLLLISAHSFVDNLKSLRNLYNQFLLSDNLNFIGEPLQGLQLMGFLETQTLDFKHLILVSTNEGILPKTKKPESFIPFDVRKQYHIPTYQEEEISTNYLFNRLLERSKKVTLLYNTDADTFGNGEQSRYITKLLTENPHINHHFADAIIPTDSVTLQSIKKTPEIIAQIKELFQNRISPSALTSYVYNPIEFYKTKILNKKEMGEIEETVAETTLGNIVHHTLENLYKPFVGEFLDINELHESKKNIRQEVIQSFKEYYPNGTITEGINKLIFEVAINFVDRFINQEISQLKKGNQIKIIALEYEINERMEFKNIDFPIVFYGFVDRVDELNGTLRIIDYKTGKVDGSQMRINDFHEKITNYKYSKALQVMLYAYLIFKNFKLDSEKVIHAGIISFKNHKLGFIPANFAGRGEDIIINAERLETFKEVIEVLLQEILDPEIDFLEKVN